MKDGVGGNYQMRGLPGPKANLLPSEPPAVSTQRPLGAKEQLNSNGGVGGVMHGDAWKMEKVHTHKFRVCKHYKL